MLFDRRVKPLFWERLRVALWPRRTWSRSARYFLKRLFRLSASPHAVAAGAAAGAFVSFSPFIGTHLFQAAFLAWITRGNVLASAIGTWIGNPLTFPFIWAASYETGRWLLGDSGGPPIDFSALFHQSWRTLWPILKPMTIGGWLLAVPSWFVVYFLVRALVIRSKRRRLARFDGLAMERKLARDRAVREAQHEQ